MDQIPSVGRIVHYISYGTPNGEYKSEHRAAVITAVKEDETCDLCILNPTGMFFNQNVKHDEAIIPESPENLGHQPSGGTWHWPERV